MLGVILFWLDFVLIVFPSYNRLRALRKHLDECLAAINGSQRRLEGALPEQELCNESFINVVISSVFFRGYKKDVYRDVSEARLNLQYWYCEYNFLYIQYSLLRAMYPLNLLFPKYPEPSCLDC